MTTTENGGIEMPKIEAHETKEVEQSRWVEWCDIFTNGNHGRPIKIELVGDVVGSEPIVDGAAFVAIDYDTLDKGNDFVVSYGQTEAASSHVVERPVAVWEGQDKNGKVIALDIESEGDRHAILTFG